MFVGLDKLTPRDDSISKSSKRAESHQSSIVLRPKEIIITPTFWKGKNEENCVQGQRVVTFIQINRPVRGCVRYIGKDIDRNGKMGTTVGLKLVS